MPADDVPIKLDDIRTRNGHKIKLHAVTYESDEGGGWHGINWLGSKVLASSFSDFQAENGQLVIIARSGNQQVILSAPGVSRFLSKLTDLFPGTELNGDKWDTFTGEAIVSGGRLHLGGVLGDTAVLIQANETRIGDQNYILDSFFCKIEPDTNGFTGQSITEILFRGVTGPVGAFRVQQVLEEESGLLQPYYGSHGPDVPDEPYYPLYHRDEDAYLMVRQEAGNLAFRTSPDGLSWPRLVWSYPVVIGELQYINITTYYESTAYISHVNKVS